MDQPLQRSGEHTLRNQIGSELFYDGSPSNGQYYTAPEGAQNRLKKVASGWEEYQPNGLKRTYNSQGVQTGWQAQAGTWTVSRDANGNIQSIQDPAGRLTTFSHALVGGVTRLSGITDSAGRTTAFTFSSSSPDRLTQVTSPELCETFFSYDGDGRLTNWVTPAGLVTTFGYDATTGELNKIERLDGLVTITYGNNTMEIRDARGNRTTYIKDAAAPGQLQALIFSGSCV